MTRRPRAPEGRRGRPAAGTHRTAATTAANRVRDSCDARMIRKLCDVRPEEVRQARPVFETAHREVKGHG